MSLRYVFGKPGSGKTFFCMDEMLREQDSDGDRSLICIVPDQFTLQTERELTKLSEGRGLMRLQVLSFKRLAHFVFTKTDVAGKKLLEDVGASMLLRRIVSEVESQLIFYKTAADKPGFIDRLREIIREFYSYNITAADLSAIVSEPWKNENLRCKMADLSLIMERYSAYIAKNYLSNDGTLDLLSDVLSKNSYLNDAAVWIDGFYGFVPQERKIIEKLLLCGANVTITFNCEPPDSSQSAPYLDYFRTQKKSIEALDKFAAENSVEKVSPIYLQDSYRHRNSPEFLHLIDNFLKFNHKIYAGQTEKIKIRTYENLYKETEAACEEIYRLTRDCGYKYRDIAILASPLAEFGYVINSVFSKHGIPVFIDKTKNLLSHPLIELLRSALCVISDNWTADSVFGFLKTGLTRLHPKHINKLENYVLAYGIRGGKWKNEWTFGFTGRYEDFDSTKMNVLRGFVVGMLAPLTENITKTKKLSIRKATGILYTFLEKLQTTRMLEKWISAAKKSGEIETADLHLQVWNKLIGIFDKMNEILGDEQVNCDELLSILEAGFAGTDLAAVPPTLDQVTAIDVRRSKLHDVKALLVLGATADAFPSKLTDDGVLSDSDRVFLEQQFNLLLISPSIFKGLEEHLLIYNELVKPRELLYISYHHGSLQGASYLPSPIVNKIANMFPGADLSLNNTGLLPGLFSQKSAFSSYVRYLLEKKETGIAVDCFESLTQLFDGRYADTLRTVSEIISGEKNEVYLSEKSVKLLYNKKMKTSVSRLEQFVRCPFSYFAEYNLRAKERKLSEVQRIDIGNLFHKAIDIFSEKVISGKVDLSVLSSEQISELSNLCIDRALEDSGEIFLNTSQSQSFARNAKNVAKTSIRAIVEHIKAGDYSLGLSEAEFGNVELVLPDGSSMIIAGKIDRVDFLPPPEGSSSDSLLVKVIDYKSGRNKFSFTEVFYGLQLQLLIYLDSFIKSYNKSVRNPSERIDPAGAFYFRLSDPYLPYSKKHTDSDTLKQDILKEFKMSGIVLKDIRAIKSMDRLFERTSDVIPVSINKTDGEFSKKSCTLEHSEFNKLLGYAVGQAKQIGGRITRGDVSIKPYKFRKTNGCDYCAYKHICRFDPAADAKNYRSLPDIGEDAAKTEILKY